MAPGHTHSSLKILSQPAYPSQSKAVPFVIDTQPRDIRTELANRKNDLTHNHLKYISRRTQGIENVSIQEGHQAQELWWQLLRYIENGPRKRV